MYGRPHKCQQCGAEFAGTYPRADKKYCSNKCRQAAHRERARKARWDALAKARDARAARNPKRKARPTKKHK